jgi:Domain of unknown function (DUF5047)
VQKVSKAFLQEITRSHVVYSYVDVISVTGKKTRLTATDGTVSVDRTAAIRRRFSCDCVDPSGTLTPESDGDLLTPFGTVAKLYRGVMYTSGPLAGSTEVAPLGVFRLSASTIKDTVGGLPNISLEGYDYSRTVSRDAFTDVYTVATGYNVLQAVQDIINRSIDDVKYDVITSNMVLSAPMVFDANTDPWTAATTLAAAAGCEVYFTATNKCVIAPPLDIDHLPSPVFNFIEGDGCTMTELDVVFSDDPGNNGVVLVGESTGTTTPPIRSVQWDTNPSSATYYLGPYGQVPLFITNTAITTQSDADAAATAALNQVLGFHSQLSLTAMVNPALDAGDVVAVQRQRVKVDSSYGVDSLTIPLSASGTSGIVLRQKRTT